jgi:hypothetical protein
MSLQFANSATSDRVACGSAAAIDSWTACTFAAWVYPTAAAGADLIRRIGSKVDTGTGNGKGFSYATHTAYSVTNGLNWRINRATTAADSSGGSLTANAWTFVAGTYNESDGPRIWIGTLTTSVAEISYTDGPVVGSGGTTAEATGALWWGNREASPAITLGFQGRIGRAMYINRRMVLADLLRIQFAPIRVWNSFTEAKALYEFWGTTTLHDVSGNANAGTISGDVTTANHVPLGAPFGIDSGYMPYVVAAGGAATYPGWFVNSKGGWW